jgi:hypothetical protein
MLFIDGSHAVDETDSWLPEVKATNHPETSPYCYGCPGQRRHHHQPLQSRFLAHEKSWPPRLATVSAENADEVASTRVRAS